MAGRITQKHIAESLGLSVQAVSLALRGRKEVSESTRQRVLDKAKKLGYQPDVALRALADYRTGRRAASTRWNRVALVHSWPSEFAWRSDRFYAKMLEELRMASARRGIEIEEHWQGERGRRAAAVFRLLRNKGITGVFLAPPGLTADEPEIAVPRGPFQIVTFGPEHIYSDLHTVQFDFYGNLRLAWSVLWSRGRRRIGLVYRKLQDWRTGHAWRAAHQVEKELAGYRAEEMLPLKLEGVDASSDFEAFSAWLRQGRYDALISSLPGVLDWVSNLEDPPEVAIFNVSETGAQGVDLNLAQLAETAVELLYMEMQRSLVNERAVPFRVHVPGRWVDRA